MASYNKFNDFVEQLGLAKHDLNTHTIKVYLSNTAPSATLDAVKADLAEIAAGNGYAAGGVDVQNTWSESGGLGSCTGIDVSVTASGGSIGPFQYAILYNADQVSPLEPLIAWYDRGAPVTLNNGDIFQIDFPSTIFDIQ